MGPRRGVYGALAGRLTAERREKLSRGFAAFEVVGDAKVKREVLAVGKRNTQRKKVDSVIMPAAVAIANGNPIGLIAVGGRKVYGKANGANKLER